MHDYHFVAEMVQNCGWDWNHSYLLGYWTARVRHYLRGDMTREEFTAEFARYELAKTAFYNLFDQYGDPELAMRHLVANLHIVTETLPALSGDGAAPS